MAADGFARSLAFVWQPGFDDPADGYHVTPGDPGRGTIGGVIEATWADAIAMGLVIGQLQDATPAQLVTVLRAKCWGPACDALPRGLDLLLFNGRMMSGGYGAVFQAVLGLTGDDDVDDVVGPETLKIVPGRDVATLIHALTGAHWAYLRRLPTWKRFGNGWTVRLLAARVAALAEAAGAPAA